MRPLTLLLIGFCFFLFSIFYPWLLLLSYTHNIEINDVPKESPPIKRIETTKIEKNEESSASASASAPTSSIFPQKCTSRQLDLLTDMLPDRRTIKWNTNCPDSTWMEDKPPRGNSLAAMDLPVLWEPSQQRTPLSIFVGCNKAMDAISTLRMLSLNSTFDKDTWRKGMQVNGSACAQHSKPQLSIRSGQNARQALVHCIEAMPSTFDKLNSTVHKLGWQESLIIHHAAMSDTDGFTLFPNAGVGVEYLGIDACSKPQYRESCQNVTQYKLDTFLDHHVMSTIPNQTIDFLSIDVEGYDWPVLLGSTSALQQTKYLEFEYHYVGAWKKFSLLTAIDTLQDQGFCCYWAGRAGKLWRITGCWLEHFHSKQWSNVACVNREKAPTLSFRMEERFFETLGKHEKFKEAAANRTYL